MKKSQEERKEVILKMLNEAGRLTVETIVAQLGVSAMTVNRDIRELASEGKIRRLHGLVLTADVQPQPGGCALCRQEVSERTQFLYLYHSRSRVSYCCPHCGLSQLDTTPAPAAVFATDFLFGTLIDAFSAAYLLGSRVNLCCLPSVLCFRNREDALDFQKGFGGELFTLSEATHYLYRSRVG